jgi:hypothetical protein
MLSPTQSNDVLLHACVNVCPCLSFSSSLTLSGPHAEGIPKHKSTYTSFRGGVRLIPTSHLAKTSTRISVLSP